MYEVKKRIEISASHKLNLPYDSKCSEIHGHNWIITIFCRCESLNIQGMVIDFSDIKSIINKKMDHKNLNEQFDFNPTAENMAKWLCDNISNCFKVVVQESENNIATYIKS
jgi:6-pyruvoyltetrahydropterin/6-carboxytetrahydropterin synthase